MKTNKIASIVMLTVLLTGACVQKPIEPTSPVTPPAETPDAGDTDLGKFVAVGDSYIAGMQAGALFTAGQNNSIPKILSTQFALAGGAAFNQPDINHVNGFNASFSSVPTVIRGRLVLYDADGSNDPDGAGCQVSRSAAPRATGDYTGVASPTCPSLVVTPNMPDAYLYPGTSTPVNFRTAQSPLDPGFAYGGDKLTLNNFGVPGAKLIHATFVGYGSGAGNPYFARFATNAGTTMIADAAGRGGSFFVFSFGMFDMLNYATTGATANPDATAGNNDMTPLATFQAAYGATLAGMLAVPNSKGVVATVPDITSLPYFFTVLWNQIEFKTSNCTDAATLAQLNGPAGFGGYNAALDGLAAAMVITPAEAAKRKVVYNYGKNGILIKDETLADLTAALNGINPALAPYGQVRQANATDIITLAAGGVLGTCPNPPNNPAFVTGVSAPLDDAYVLLPSETAVIQARITGYNDAIKAAATASAGRVAVADINAAFKALVTNKVYVADNVTLAPTFAPPAGMFSEDGIHPNNRGAAFTANIFIDAINATFNAKIPKANLAAYGITAIPVNGQ